jgi:hypothetical protein
VRIAALAAGRALSEKSPLDDRIDWLLFWDRGRPISPHAGKRRLIEPHTFFNGPHLRATAGENLAGA